MKLIDQSCRNHVCFNVLGVCASDQLGRCMSHPTGFTSKGRCAPILRQPQEAPQSGQHGSPMLPVGLFYKKTCMHPRVQYIAMQPVYWLEIRNYMYNKELNVQDKNYMYARERLLCHLTVQQSLNSQKFGDSFWRNTVRCYILTRSIYINTSRALMRPSACRDHSIERISTAKQTCSTFASHLETTENHN